MGVLPCSGHPDLHIHAPAPPCPAPLVESTLIYAPPITECVSPYVNVRQVNVLRSSVQLNVWFAGEVYLGREVGYPCISEPLILPLPYHPHFSVTLSLRICSTKILHKLFIVRRNRNETK